MKKKIIKLSIALVAVLLLVHLAAIVYFDLTTIKDVAWYCKENSMTNAESFKRHDTHAAPNYAFWVAKDGDLQEIFIFRNASFGLQRDTGRYKYVYQATAGSTNPVGSVMFTPRDENNKKSDANMIVFFSANTEKIVSYRLTIQENSVDMVGEGGVARDMPFIFAVSNLGSVNGVAKKFVKIEFYDVDNNLVQTLLG